MPSKAIAGWLLAACASIARADTVYQTPEDFLRDTFGTPPPAKALWLDKATQAKIQATLGHPYAQARLRYWRAAGKTGWILEEIGKEYPITAGFVVTAGRIERVRVLVYRETRGMEVRYPAFLAQFAGAALAGDRLSKPVDGISGATLSVQAMERMARTALTLDALAP